MLHSRLQKEEPGTALIPVLAINNLGWSVTYTNLYSPNLHICDLQSLLGFNMTAENQFYPSSIEFWVRNTGNFELFVAFLSGHLARFSLTKGANTDVGKMLCTLSLSDLWKFNLQGEVGQASVVEPPSSSQQLCKPSPCLLRNCSCPYLPAGRKGKAEVMWPLVFWNNMITMHIFKGHDCWRTAGDGGGNSLPLTFRPGRGTRRTCRACEKQWGKLGVARRASLSPFIISEIDLY